MDAVALAQALGQQMPQIAFAREVLRRMEHRVMQLAELDLQVALLGHLQRVLHRLRDLGKARLHLLRRTQIELLLGVPQPLGIGQLRLRADADQAVVRVRVALLDVMHVVRRDQLQAELLRPGNQVPIDLGLLGQAVVLQLQVEVLRPEGLLEPVNRLARLGQLVLLNPLRDFARQAAGERDQPLLVRRQQFLVDARLVVIALQMRRRGELDQVLVAGFILGQQHEVVIDVPSARAGLLLEPAPGRDIDLAADDRLDALLARRLVKINRPVKHAVVGDRQRGELQLVRLVHQPVQTAGAIEQRILGVQMQMNKFGVRHSSTLRQVNQPRQDANCEPSSLRFTFHSSRITLHALPRAPPPIPSPPAKV